METANIVLNGRDYIVERVAENLVVLRTGLPNKDGDVIWELKELDELQKDTGPITFTEMGEQHEHIHYKRIRNR